MGVDPQLLRALENGHQGMALCKVMSASCRLLPSGTRDYSFGTESSLSTILEAHRPRGERRLMALHGLSIAYKMQAVVIP